MSHANEPVMVSEIAHLRDRLRAIAQGSPPSTHQRNEVTTQVVQALQALWDSACARAGLINDDCGHLQPQATAQRARPSALGPVHGPARLAPTAYRRTALAWSRIAFR